MAYLHFESKAMTNDYDETERPRTPKEAAQTQVAAFRKDMREDWGWERTEQLRDLEATVARWRRLGATHVVDPEPIDKSRALATRYSASVDIEWDRGGGPSQYVIQLGPSVRIAGQLGASDGLDSARMEYQNESTPWLELPLGGDDQQAVTAFVRRLLVL